MDLDKATVFLAALDVLAAVCRLTAKDAFPIKHM
jgi:hypothetical protein